MTRPAAPSPPTPRIVITDCRIVVSDDPESVSIAREWLMFVVERPSRIPVVRKPK